VDGIETDVRLSAEGRAVLFHDRLAPSGRPVAELSVAELSGETGHPTRRRSVRQS
jgi:glycerophosphoryl diester phosphodiesterase